MILLFLSGCTQNESREEETEQNNFYVPEFTFETVLLQSDRMDMYVKASEYSESDCEELFQQICNDIELITSKTGCTGKRVVLCLADSATVNYYTVEGAELYCTCQQIVNGDYRWRLLEEMYDLHDYGMLTGLSSYLFSDDREKEAVNLADYYADPAHLPALSLFAAYFNEAFADDETVTAAEETARQFVGYILDTYILTVRSPVMYFETSFRSTRKMSALPISPVTKRKGRKVRIHNVWMEFRFSKTRCRHLYRASKMRSATEYNCHDY